METGLLILRIVLGGTMAAHGAQKMFGWFEGPGLQGVSGWLASMGLRPAKAQATTVGLAELGGGILLLLGLLTPLAAAAVAGVMFVAIATVHWSNGFFNTEGGFEFNLLITASALALAFTGPGRISLDRALGWDLAGNGWGVGALLLSLLGAGFVLALREPQFEQAEEQSSEDHAEAA